MELLVYLVAGLLMAFYAVLIVAAIAEEVRFVRSCKRNEKLRREAEKKFREHQYQKIANMWKD